MSCTVMYQPYAMSYSSSCDRTSNDNNKKSFKFPHAPSPSESTHSNASSSYSSPGSTGAAAHQALLGSLSLLPPHLHSPSASSLVGASSHGGGGGGGGRRPLTPSCASGGGGGVSGSSASATITSAAQLSAAQQQQQHHHSHSSSHHSHHTQHHSSSHHHHHQQSSTSSGSGGGGPHRGGGGGSSAASSSSFPLSHSSLNLSVASATATRDLSHGAGGGGGSSSSSSATSSSSHHANIGGGQQGGGRGGGAGDGSDDDSPRNESAAVEEEGVGGGGGGGGHQGSSQNRAYYLSANCVLYVNYDGNAARVVEEHFNRALSGPFPGDKSSKSAVPMSTRNFPASFWNSNYQPAKAALSSYGAADFYGTAMDYSAATIPGFAAHHHAQADPWHYPLGTHHHHHHQSYHRPSDITYPPMSSTSRFNAAQYGSLLFPGTSAAAAAARFPGIPTPGQCSVKGDAAHHWAAAGGRYDGWSDFHLAADYSAAAAAHYSNMTAAAGKGLDFETHYLQSS